MEHALAGHKTKLLYLWPRQSQDIQEAARQIGYYGYETQLIDTLEQLFEQIAAAIPTGILVDCDQACEQSPAHKEELTKLAQNIPVVCMSERSDIGARLSAVRMGCVAYFTRPLDTTSLLDTLDRLTAPA